MGIPADIKDGLALVIEDDDDMRALLKSLLQSLGFREVDGISSVGQAVHRLEYQNITMAIVDLNLGDGDGVTVISDIRKSPRVDLRSIPILVASTASTGTRIRASIEAGADAFLSKPFSFTNLKRQILFACGKAELRSRNSDAASHAPGNTRHDVLELD